MTTDRHPVRQMLVSGSLGTLVVGGACVVGGWLLRDVPGLWGALLGGALVWVSSAISLLALGATRRADPVVAMMVALVVHTGKVVAIIVALVALGSSGVLEGRVDRWSLAVTIVALVLTWTLAEIASYLRTRQPTYDLDARTGADLDAA